MAKEEKVEEVVNEEAVAAEPPKRKRGRPRKTEADGTAAVAKPKTTRRGKYAWPTLMDKLDNDEELVDYNIKSDFTDTGAIRHKKFGVGFVLKVLDVNKIEVVFEDAKKVLAQNWE